MTLQNDPTFECNYRAGNKIWPATVSCKYVSEGIATVVEMERPRGDDDFTARVLKFEVTGDRHEIISLSILELAPGGPGGSPPISDEWLASEDVLDVKLLDLMEFAIRKVRPKAYSLGYAICRLDEVRRRVERNVANAISDAVQAVRSKDWATQELRKLDDAEIESQIESEQLQMDGASKRMPIWIGDYEEQVC